MLHELDDVTSVWLQDPIRNWRDWPASAAAAAAQDKALAGDDVAAGGLLTKVNEDKLARDVDDLSAIFDELADGVVDFPLPCDEDDDEDAAGDVGALAEAISAPAAGSSDGAADVVSDEELATGAVGEWLDKLDSDDALNVDEISEAFDALVAEQEELLSLAAPAPSEADDDGDDVEMDESDDAESEDDEEDDVAGAHALSVQIVPAAPVWATMAPLDPRSCIKTSVFKGLDARIPRIEIPRIDLAFAADKGDGAAAAATRACGPFASAAGASLSPVRASAKTAEASAYRHDPATCWICKSSKTPERKRALHRFLEKRGRRNWKKGPRYSGRSSVAASRVRNGGRFICTTQWI